MAQFFKINEYFYNSQNTFYTAYIKYKFQMLNKFPFNFKLKNKVNFILFVFFISLKVEIHRFETKYIQINLFLDI
jgi:hypothetical protein